MASRVPPRGPFGGSDDAPVTHHLPVALDRNENHYGPAPACLAVLQELAPDLLHDYSREVLAGGYGCLSRRLAALHGVDEARIALGYGCEDILKEVVHYHVGPGDVILGPSASWWYYRAVADEVGGRTVEYPLVEQPTSYAYDIERLLALRDEVPVRLLLIATPNNPTGNRIARDDLRLVLDHYRGVPVVLDQAYFGFADEGPDTWAALTDEFPDLLVLRSFSKLYALAGVRIGYAIAGVRHQDFLKARSRYLGYNRISERLALTALESPEYYEDVRARMDEDRRQFYERLRPLKGVRAYDSAGNFVLTRFPMDVVGSLDAELRRRGFVVKFFKEAAFLDCARITLGTQVENARLLEAMTEVLPSMLSVAV
jgi:histidinol-phosphate aminotransferase